MVQQLEVVQQLQSQRRKRGVILSPRGWQRLQAAEQRLAEQTNSGKPYTLEQLGELIDLSPNTITKVRRKRLAVDRQTLELYFNALHLSLNTSDYISLDSDAIAQSLLRKPLQGQLSLDSSLYIDRPPIEQQVCEEILQPGAFIRIRAPHQFGKTSLMTRTLAWVRDKELPGTILSLHLADSMVLANLDRFLRWFCAVITQNLQIPNRVDDYWDTIFGSSYNCTRYFESYLLPEINAPLVLALDGADVLFHYPEIASDFFGMLRAWYEKARYGNSNIWQQLRLIVVYSNEIYLPLDFNQSPFNVGLSVELSAFTQEQVLDLVQRYGIGQAEIYAEQLTQLLGGNPYLTQLALYHISTKEIALEQLQQQAIASDGIFSAHLRQQFAQLQLYPELLAVLKIMTQSLEPIDLDPLFAFRLQSMGLIRVENFQGTISCKLYQQYFERALRLSVTSSA
ncbi:MAG TPA: AAA-like domain-containing protein [Coleofasciculaceae cyanobacterium]|jgi:transcriptional regulator with XRE-family HTH domain